MKKVVNTYYVHCSCLSDLLGVVADEDRKELENFIRYYKESNSKESFVFKYDKKKHTLSQIDCPTFDTLKEPIVGDCHIFYFNTMEVRKVKASRSNPQIYHSKELFVHEDYKGFDIKEAKRRTKEWNAIPNLDKSKISRRNYWLQLLAENNMED